VAAPPVTGMAIPVLGLSDVEQVRRETRDLARGLAFSAADVERTALAASELAMNLLQHAQQGEIHISEAREGSRVGLTIESDDVGPGIVNVDRAMNDGFSTTGGLGSGLPGIRRLMDDFSIASTDRGTKIVAHKWRTR